MATYPRVLSLCSGYGGLDLAIKRVFSAARTICYVEREISAAHVLAARMAEGALDSAPVWDDVNTFDPIPWTEAVDLVVAGFPCQPHSVAGKREGTSDHRWPVWDDIIRIAKSCAARSVFLENVPGLLTSSKGASIAKVRADLDGAGFTDQSACVLGARDVGASHKRDRLFILAHAESVRDAWWSKALSAEALHWPTPNARDWKDGRLNAEYTNARPLNEVATAFLPLDLMQTGQQLTPNSGPRQLNPLFVEWLMGLPEGWTSVEQTG